MKKITAKNPLRINGIRLFAEGICKTLGISNPNGLLRGGELLAGIIVLFVGVAIADLQNFPKASFRAKPLAGQAPLEIDINNLVENNNYEWDFGNGTTYTGDYPPPVMYETPGQYTISLKARERGGIFRQSALATVDIMVYTPMPVETSSALVPSPQATASPTVIPVTPVPPVSTELFDSNSAETQLRVTYNTDNAFIYVEPPPGETLALGDLDITGIKQDGNPVTLQVGDAYDYQIINEITKPTCFVLRVQNIPAGLIGSPEGCTHQNALYSREIPQINVPWRDSVTGIEFGVVTFRFGSQEKQCELATLPCEWTIHH